MATDAATRPADPVAAEAPQPAPAKALPAPVGLVAATLAERLRNGDQLFLATDDVRAASIAGALKAAAPDVHVALVPASDALPGDSSPPTAANVGHRVAAFRCLRRWLQAEDRRPVALIASAEAAARLHAHRPPRVLSHRRRRARTTTRHW